MISRDPVKIYQLIESGEDLRNKHMESVADQVMRYHGPWFYGRGPTIDEEYDPNNVAYQFISLVLPVLAWDNPRFEVKSKQGPTADPVTILFRHALDRWAVDTDLQEDLEAVAVDYLFAFGVLLTEMEPTPDQDPDAKSPSKRPLIRRLDPRRFGLDPFADRPRDARISWHTWARDKEDLLEEAREFPDRGWDAEAIEMIAPDAGLAKFYRDKNVRATPMRDEIIGYQIWFPEWEHDDTKKLKGDKRRLFHGTLVDLAVSQNPDGGTGKDTARFIRKPRPFYGPAWGPYSVIGAYKVPGKLYPLGPLTAVEGQTRELNEHKRGYLKSARTRKKIALATNKDPELAETVLDTNEGEISLVNTDNLDRNIREIELGGATAEQRLTIVGLQADNDNALGMNDAKRGEVSGIGTATENSIADAAGNQRLSWKKKRFRKGVTDSTRTAAWYIWNEPSKFPTSPDASKEVGMPGQSLSFHGGDEEPKGGAVASSKAAFEDLELGIEIMSTERLDEGVAQARAMQVFGMLAQAVPVMAMAPMGNWKEAFDMVGESINLPDLGTKLGIDKIQEAASQGQIQPMPPTPPQAGPPGGQPTQQRLPAPKVQKGGVSQGAKPQAKANAQARLAGVGG